jgi:hypothetical protein
MESTKKGAPAQNPTSMHWLLLLGVLVLFGIQVSLTHLRLLLLLLAAQTAAVASSDWQRQLPLFAAH